MAQLSAEEKRRNLWLSVKRNKACYAMIAPFMIFFIIFTVVPVIMSLPMGFTDFNMAQTPKFIGLSNYTTLFLCFATVFLYLSSTFLASNSR